MEKDLQEYIEKLKERTLDTKDLKKAILRIKTSLDDLSECCEADLRDGDITKEQILKDFLDEYKKDTIEPSEYQTVLTLLSSEYEGCKKILKLAKGNKKEYFDLINYAKKYEKDNSTEKLYHTINSQGELNTLARIALRSSKKVNIMKNPTQNIPITHEDILTAISNIKNTVEKQIRRHMQPSLEGMMYFLDNFGYLDEIITKTDELFDETGLSELKAVKRNPIPSKEYDIHNARESEDMGIIDFFKKENIENLSPNELMLLELFWKTKYFNARLDISEALSVIDYLDLWPMLLEEDKSAIENIDDDKLNIALKRDLALTYLIRNKNSITPELEQRYVKFLEDNGMTQKGTTYEEIETQSKELEGALSISNDLVLGECVIVDKLLNGQLGETNWGTMDNSEFDDADEHDENKVIIAINHPNFRGPLLIAMSKEHITSFVNEKNTGTKLKKLKFPKYKCKISEEYSHIMSNLLLPTSPYFKKYVTEKYVQNPESPLYEQLATEFAGAKKIKTPKNKQGNSAR